ncbi:hypothetical protein [Nocardia sp. NPDC050435]
MSEWRVVVVDNATAAGPAYRLLLEQLQASHPLRDSRFDRWLTKPRRRDG